MTDRTSPMRRHTRFPVRWPVLYGSDELLAKGTLLDLTPIGWRVAGSMPVSPGMELVLELSIPDKSEGIRIERATVLWVTGCEFALEVREMEPAAQTWINEFLKHKLGLQWMSETAEHEDLSQPFDEYSHVDPAIQDKPSPHGEDIARMFFSGSTPMKEIEDEVIRRCMAQLTCPEEEARVAYGRFIHEVWQPALRIVRGMMTQKLRRELRGDDSITHN